MRPSIQLVAELAPTCHAGPDPSLTNLAIMWKNKIQMDSHRENKTVLFLTVGNYCTVFRGRFWGDFLVSG